MRPAYLENRMPATRVAIAGLGAIGRVLAERLAAGVPGLQLTCIAARDEDKARRWLVAQGISCPLVSLAELPLHADLAVECAPAEALEDICRPMLEAGKKVMVVSAGALLQKYALFDLAKERGGQIMVPTGALLGLDAVTAAAEGKIRLVRLTTRKPPASLAGAPYLEQHGVSLEDLQDPMRVFVGSAREAAAGFPANMNVAAALALAGVGPERTTVEIWADPGVTRNCHTVEVDGDAAHFTMSIQNIPSDNAKTGRITALSILAALRKLHAPLRVGT
jgi:aspartate dehydrogenase